MKKVDIELDIWRITKLNKIIIPVYFLSCILSINVLASAEGLCKENLSQKTDDCIRDLKNMADQELNAEYKLLKNKISRTYPSNDPVMISLLKNITEAQRAWVKYRDLNCSVESSLAEDKTPAHEMLTNKCIARMSHVRAQELHGIAKEY